MSVGKRQPVAITVVPAGHLFLRVSRFREGDVWAALLMADPMDASRPAEARPPVVQWPVSAEFADGLADAVQIMFAELASARIKGVAV